MSEDAMTSQDAMTSREKLEQAVDWIYKLLSDLDDPDIADQGGYVDEQNSNPRRTRRDYSTAERPERHRARWEEIESEAALALYRIGWSRYEIGELLDRTPHAVQRLVEKRYLK